MPLIVAAMIIILLVIFIVFLILRTEIERYHHSKHRDEPVSYTHLDVYKRQVQNVVRQFGPYLSWA